MKHLITALLLFFTLATYSKKELPGYIVRSGGDTTHGFINVPMSINPMVTHTTGNAPNGPAICNSKVSFIASKGAKATKHKADDIVGFGFTYRDSVYHYRSINTSPLIGKDIDFALLIIDGPVQLYHHWNQSTTTVGVGGVSGGGLVITEEYIAKEPLKALRIAMLSDDTSAMKLMGDKPEIKKMIEESKYSIEEIVEAYNAK